MDHLPTWPVAGMGPPSRLILSLLILGVELVIYLSGQWAGWGDGPPTYLVGRRDRATSSLLCEETLMSETLYTFLHTVYMISNKDVKKIACYLQKIKELLKLIFQGLSAIGCSKVQQDSLHLWGSTDHGLLHFFYFRCKHSGGSVVRKNQETWEEQQPDEEGQSGVVLVKSHNSIMDQTTSAQNSSRLNNTTGTTIDLILQINLKL